MLIKLFMRGSLPQITVVGKGVNDKEKITTLEDNIEVLKNLLVDKDPEDFVESLMAKLGSKAEVRRFYEVAGSLLPFSTGQAIAQFLEEK